MEPDASSLALPLYNDVSIVENLAKCLRPRPGANRTHNSMGMAFELCNLEQKSIVTLLAKDNLSDSFSLV